jgi:hypothetical protein
MDIKEIISSLPIQAIVFCLLGIICIVAAFYSASGNKKLKETGIAADGIIYSLEESTDQSDTDISFRNVKDVIIVRFLTKDNVWITERYKSKFLIAYTGQYKPGEAVKVIYDPNNPQIFTLESRQSEKIRRILFGLAGLIFFVIGIFQYFKK